MAVHRQIVHPIQCRAGAPDAGGCIEPVLSQRFSWGDTEGYQGMAEGFLLWCSFKGSIGADNFWQQTMGQTARIGGLWHGSGALKEG